MCDDCAKLLSQGLDLCVRARDMDAKDRTAAAMRASSAPVEWWTMNLSARAEAHNETFPDAPMSPRSATYPIWLEHQYQSDLADWERRSRHHLMQGCANKLI